MLLNMNIYFLVSNMWPRRTFYMCYICHGFKTLASRNMSILATGPIVVPEHLCNLAKQLNVNNSILATVVKKNDDKLKLYTDSQWLVLFEYLNQYDFKSSELLEMVDSNPDILSINRQKLHKCMTAWTNFRFDDKKLRKLLILQPSCLLLDDKQILSRIPKLLAYVKNKNNRLLELISYSPNVLFDNWNCLESKLDYLLLNMELDTTQFVTTSVMSSTLFDIKCRHNFLVKLGMYKNRDPKSDSNQITTINNPTLKRIIETNDKQFAVKVAGVTAEEFFVFKELYKKQMADENEYNSDEDDY